MSRIFLKSLNSHQITQDEVVDFSICQWNYKAKFTLTWVGSEGNKLLGKKRASWCREAVWQCWVHVEYFKQVFPPQFSVWEPSSLRTGASFFCKMPSLSCNQRLFTSKCHSFSGKNLSCRLLNVVLIISRYINAQVQFRAFSQTLLPIKAWGW